MAIMIALYCDNHSAVFLYDLGVQNISYYNNIILLPNILHHIGARLSYLLKIDTKSNSALQIPTITSEIMSDLIFMAQHRQYCC